MVVEAAVREEQRRGGGAIAAVGAGRSWQSLCPPLLALAQRLGRPGGGEEEVARAAGGELYAGVWEGRSHLSGLNLCDAAYCLRVRSLTSGKAAARAARHAFCCSSSGADEKRPMSLSTTRQRQGSAAVKAGIAWKEFYHASRSHSRLARTSTTKGTADNGPLWAVEDPMTQPVQWQQDKSCPPPCNLVCGAPAPYLESTAFGAMMSVPIVWVTG